MDVFEGNRRVYGVPGIMASPKGKGICIPKDRCPRLTEGLGIEGAGKRRKRPRSKHTRPEAASSDDLVCRGFSAGEPDEVRFAGTAYVKTCQGWLYPAIVFDVLSRMAVGWSMGHSMHASLVDDALLTAMTRRRPGKGIIRHSDHGSQCRSLPVGKTMREYGIRPSMGGIASPWDDAATGSSMPTIKAECVRRRAFQSREGAQIGIFDYIGRFYNEPRMHSAPGYRSPKEYGDEYCSVLKTEEGCLQN